MRSGGGGCKVRLEGPPGAQGKEDREFLLLIFASVSGTEIGSLVSVDTGYMAERRTRGPARLSRIVRSRRWSSGSNRLPLLAGIVVIGLATSAPGCGGDGGNTASGTSAFSTSGDTATQDKVALAGAMDSGTAASSIVEALGLSSDYGLATCPSVVLVDQGSRFVCTAGDPTGGPLTAYIYVQVTNAAARELTYNIPDFASTATTVTVPGGETGRPAAPPPPDNQLAIDIAQAFYNREAVTEVTDQPAAPDEAPNSSSALCNLLDPSGWQAASGRPTHKSCVENSGLGGGPTRDEIRGFTAQVHGGTATVTGTVRSPQPPGTPTYHPPQKVTYYLVRGGPHGWMIDGKTFPPSGLSDDPVNPGVGP